MANYLKLFVDCLEKYQKLNDTEFGRLVRAALRYKATGAEPTDLGREALLWDGMRLDIDRDNEAYAKTVKARSDAGKRGGRPKKEEENASDKKQKKQMLFSESKKSQDKEEDKDKDKDKEKEIYITAQSRNGSGQESAQISPQAASVVIKIPLNDGAEYPLTDADVAEYQQLYPAVDVVAELRKMRGWVLADPKRRKTARGVRRFVNGWLSRTQDRGKPAKTQIGKAETWDDMPF